MLMITDYAILAGHIYGADDVQYLGVPINTVTRANLLPDSEDPPPSNSWVRVEDIDSAHMSEEQDCFAQLYLNIIDNRVDQAVIAIRGTYSFHNILADLKTYTPTALGLSRLEKLYPASDSLASRLGWDDNVLSYLGKLHHFYEVALDYMLAHFPQAYMLNGISITGHSLGGALATLLVLTASVGHAPVVAFNAPGCGNLEGIHPELFPLIYNVNARYDAVSKVDTPVGHLCWVDVPQHQDGAKMLLADYVAKHPYPTSEPDPTRAHPEFGNLHLTNANLAAPNATDSACIPLSPSTAQLAAVGSEITGTNVLAIKKGYCVINTSKVDANILLAQHSMDNLALAVRNDIIIGTRLVF